MLTSKSNYDLLWRTSQWTILLHTVHTRIMRYDIDGLMQERRNCSALAMYLRPSCINPPIWLMMYDITFTYGGSHMMTSLNGNISALLAICAGNSPVPGEFPAQRLVTRSFDVVFDLHLNKWLSKQSWSWWFETLSRPLWRHRNDFTQLWLYMQQSSGHTYLDLWSQR